MEKMNQQRCSRCLPFSVSRVACECVNVCLCMHEHEEHEWQFLADKDIVFRAKICITSVAQRWWWWCRTRTAYTFRRSFNQRVCHENSILSYHTLSSRWQRQQPEPKDALVSRHVCYPAANVCCTDTTRPFLHKNHLKAVYLWSDWDSNSSKRTCGGLWTHDSLLWIQSIHEKVPLG